MSNYFNSQAIAAGTEILTLKSLGNLDKHHSSSQLKSLRVAIISGDQRNYASLLTKRGYQDIATQYLNTASPQVPLASLYFANPLNGLVPTAHAEWSWGGVWSGVKSTVGFLIPYEDFIIIYEQLGYLIDQDWENFDSSKLAFASLGAATVIPIVKPLKPLLGPIKKMLDGMKKFPASRHFAGAIGTAVKEAFKNKTDKIVNFLPFILIALELYESPEVFEFLMSAIESEDDLWVWVEYIAEVVKVEGGLDLLSSYNAPYQWQNINNTQYAMNPLSFMVANAQAKSTKGITDKLIIRFKRLTKSFDLKDAKGVTSALKQVMKDPVMRKIAAKGKSALTLFSTIGAAKITKFIRDSRTWRANRWLVLFSMVYLLEEYNGGNGNLQLSSESQITGLINNLFSKNLSNSNGAVFQIVQTAYYHARHQAATSTMPKVIGIDSVRAAFTLINGRISGNAYPRRPDIILEHPDGKEEWVELKSYSKNTIQKSVRPNNKIFAGANVFREFFHDYRLNDEFITQDPTNKKNILDVLGHPAKTNQIFTWYYQDYKTPKGTKNTAIAPTESQLKTMRKKLCKKPTDFGVKSYQGNFGKAQSAVNKQCLSAVDKSVTLFNTKDYFVEVLKLVGNDFALDIVDELSGIE